MNANVTSIGAEDAISRARNEIADETMKKGVEKLKVKLREQAAAKVVYDNATREVDDLEASIKQGNI